MWKASSGIIAAALAIGMVAVGVALPASAHTPNVSAICSTLTVDLTAYQTKSNDATPNSVTVTLNDANAVESKSFGTEFHGKYSFPGATSGQTYKVEVTAWDDPDGSKGWTKTFSGTNGNGCTPPPIVEKVCTSAGSLVVTNNAKPNLSTATVTLKPTFTSCDVSLNSYETQGPDWPSSGMQRFVDHATVHLTAANPTGVLTVKTEGCFQQQDLYIGTARFDGKNGSPLPLYPNGVFPTGLIDHWNGQVVANCGIVTPVKPSVTQAQVCGGYGTVTPVTTEGVNYVLTSFDKATGDYVVTATPKATYKFAQGKTSIEFTGNVGAYVECPSSNGIGTASVKCGQDGILVNLSNKGDKVNTAASFDVLVNGTKDRTVSVGIGQETSFVLTPLAEDAQYTVDIVTSGKSVFKQTLTYDCLTTVTEVPPVTFADVCGTTGDLVNVPDLTGADVHFSYKVDDQRHGGVGVVTVTALADTGYEFPTGVDAPVVSWTHTFNSDSDNKCVIVGDPIPSPGICDELTELPTNGSIWVDMVAHVSYRITGTTDAKVAVDIIPTTATTSVPSGTYTVTATATDGYVLTGQTEWTDVIVKPATACGIPTLANIATNVTSTDPVCSPSGTLTGGSITVGHITDVTGEYDAFNVGVSYFIDGVKVTSQTTPKSAGTYHVTATLDDPADVIDGLDSWFITIGAAAQACGQLTTLPFTGVSGNPIGLLMVALLLLIAGTGVYTGSRLKPRTES